MNEMVKKDLFVGVAIGFLIGLLVQPIIRNLELPVDFKIRMFLTPLLMILTPLGLMTARYLSRYLGIIYQIAKFGAVGVLNTLMDWGVLNALMFFSGIYFGLAYSGFKAVSFIIATTNSYFWNKYWTFESEEKKENEFILFFLISAVGALINVSIASLIVNLISPFPGVSLPQWANIGAAAATLVSMIWNFTGYKFIVFKK